MASSPFRNGILFVVLVLTTTLTYADTLPDEAVKLSQSELIRLLSGNSTRGHWAGRPYRQFFNSNRLTNYQEDGGQLTTGRWRIDISGQYCSVWPPSSRESCYTLRVKGADIYWQSGETYYKATVVSGNIFDQ